MQVVSLSSVIYSTSFQWAHQIKIHIFHFHQRIKTGPVFKETVGRWCTMSKTPMKPMAIYNHQISLISMIPLEHMLRTHFHNCDRSQKHSTTAWGTNCTKKYYSSSENLRTAAYQNILLPPPASPSLLPADESTPQFFVQLLLDPACKLQP